MIAASPLRERMSTSTTSSSRAELPSPSPSGPKTSASMSRGRAASGTKTLQNLACSGEDAVEAPEFGGGEVR